MCTVSFIPTPMGVFITSNRDENINRGNTLQPFTYWQNNIKLTYPKDEKGEGTWIGFNELQSVAVLLNGAFKNHLHNPPYKHSRGLIIPHILSQKNSIIAAETYSYKGLEPFTLVLYSNKKLMEFRWDEQQLHIHQLDTCKEFLWNSATLYSKELEDNNLIDLKKWLNNGSSKDDILNFHLHKKYEHQQPQNSIINNIKTISITQVCCTNQHTVMQYHDLLIKESKQQFTHVP
jgi:uncharacterized protein with NRDE domain